MYLIFFSEDQEPGTLTLTSFDWDETRLQICAEEDLHSDTRLDIILRVNDNERIVRGSLDPTSTTCALFTLEDYPFTTEKRTYELVIEDENGKLQVGTAKFSVNSTYMLYMLKYIK